MPNDNDTARQVTHYDADAEAKARIEEIRKRAETATEAPWQTRFLYRMIAAARTMQGIAINTDGAKDWVDADFMAHSREDVPFLLARLDETQAQVDAANERIAELERSEDSLLRAAAGVDDWRMGQ